MKWRYMIEFVYKCLRRAVTPGKEERKTRGGLNENFYTISWIPVETPGNSNTQIYDINSTIVYGKMNTVNTYREQPYATMHLPRQTANTHAFVPPQENLWVVFWDIHWQFFNGDLQNRAVFLPLHPCQFP